MKLHRLLPYLTPFLLAACSLDQEASSTCFEEWHIPGLAEARTQTCRAHDTYPLGDAAMGFANVDGKACFVIEHVENHIACYSSGATGPIGLFDLQCWLPEGMRSRSSEKNHIYYQLSERGSSLRRVAVDTPPRTPLPANFSNFYATDGLSVFYRDKRIDAADPETFHVYFPAQASSADWAYDKNRSYYKHSAVPGLNHDNIALIDENFVVSGSHVFSYEDYGEQLIARPEITPPLQRIASGLVRAGRQVFDQGKLSAAISPTSSRLLPVCPVPGQAGLHCQRAPGGDVGNLSEFIRNGDTVMVRDQDYEPFKTVAGAQARYFSYWWYGNDLYAIQKNTLFSLASGGFSSPRTYTFIGQQLTGFGERFVADQIGFIDLYALDRASPLCGEVDKRARPDQDGQSRYGVAPYPEQRTAGRVCRRAGKSAFPLPVE